MSRSHNVVNLGHIKIPPDVLKLIPFEIMRRHQLVPLDVQDGKILVAMTNPNDTEAIDKIQVISGHRPEICRAPADSITRILRVQLRDFADHPVCPELLPDEPTPRHEGNPKRSESQIITTLNKLLSLGIDMRASDIHLEPQRSGLFVRFRIDGTLKTIHEFPASKQAPLLSRIKILGGMDITEKRLPQDGQLIFYHKKKNIDLRVSTMPCKYGEKLVIRILDKSSLLKGLESLGMNPKTQTEFEMLIEKPYGLILVTGPTGSGKSTTLYGILNRLRSPFKNVITLEDPIEYEILANNSNELGTTQIQMNPRIGLTFATGLRSVLRQDPDVIMVGEIRDKDTAEIAMQAALTGHLVLSTLHTNDAPSTLGRLIDMGIDRYLIATTVVGVMAQRLVRVLCSHCKEGYHPPARAVRGLLPNHTVLPDAMFYRAIGCDHCQGTGYWGRIGIFELLAINEETKTIILAGEGSEGLKKWLRSQGIRTLRESGMEHVFQGLTTIDEVLRSTVE